MTTVSAAEYSDYYINGGAIVTNETGLQYQITKSDNTTSVKWNSSVTTDGAVGIQKYTVLVQSDQAENYTLYALNKYTGEERWNMSLDRAYDRLQFVGGRYAVLMNQEGFVQVNLHSHKIICGKTFDSPANEYYGLIKSKKNGNYYVMTITDSSFRFFKIVIEESSQVFAPDLVVSALTLNDGGLTIANIGNKVSPAGGFDVLVYFKKKDGTYYQNVIHLDGVIAPGYSKRFDRVFSNGARACVGLIRVNPYKTFQESDYTNNMQFFSLIEVPISSFVVAEGDGEIWRDEFFLSYSFQDTFENGDYTPLSIYQYSNSVMIYLPGWTGLHAYITVSGVPSDFSCFWLEFGDDYLKPFTYDATQDLWYLTTTEPWIQRIVLYSEEGPTGFEGIENVTISLKYMKNHWSWSY